LHPVLCDALEAFDALLILVSNAFGLRDKIDLIASSRILLCSGVFRHEVHRHRLLHVTDDAKHWLNVKFPKKICKIY